MCVALSSHRLRCRRRRRRHCRRRCCRCLISVDVSSCWRDARLRPIQNAVGEQWARCSLVRGGCQPRRPAKWDRDGNSDSWSVLVRTRQLYAHNSSRWWCVSHEMGGPWWVVAATWWGARITVAHGYLIKCVVKNSTKHVN